MFKQLTTATLLAVTVSYSAMAADTSGSTTLSVQNGVTVKTGGSAPVAAAAPASATTVAPAAEAPKQEPLFMKPIVESSKPAVKKAPAEKKEEPKTVEAKSASPFKKSQDAGVKETVKKPDPTPEVSAKPLAQEDDISAEIKKLESAKAAETPSGSEKATESGIGESGLPIPRFVTLKSGEANARTGPGETYPIRWVYQRKNLPVEITAEFKLWRRIKDFDGEQSWVHQALLSSRRYAILSRDATAYSDPEGGSGVALFKRGVQVKVIECQKSYCEVEYGRIQGWLKKKDLWGAYPDEVFD